MHETEPRKSLRLNFARHASGHSDVRLERASSDAGSRSYWRLTGAAPTRIVMDAPPASDDVRPWLAIRDLLERGGVRVPQLLARDTAHGFLLLEDLGTQTLLQVLDTDNAERLIDAAITQLLRLQAIAPPDDLPQYDAAMLAPELHLFDDWFLARHLGLALSSAALERLHDVYQFLINAALAQPQVLVHRDFMPRNLMPVGDGPAVIDFQDAVRGPIGYDPACLFKDAFISWPQARVSAWLDRYHARGTHAGLPLPTLERFRRDIDLIGVQRHLKVLGIFARLRYRDNKPYYLTDAPRFIAYLDAVVPRYPELAPLAALLEDTVKPALAQCSAAAKA